MKLVFYSGGHEEDNLDLDDECFDLIDSPNPTFAFIPSSSYDGESEFRSFVRHYQRFGVTRFLYFPVDVPQDNVFLKEVFKSDLIHMGGGNTYYFIKYLRARGLFSFLKEFAIKGGVLSGLSAGGILMTPNINTAGYPEFDKDDNEEGVQNFKALNLVKFEFFPHYRNSIRFDRELLYQSTQTGNPIFALPDGSGIVKFEDTMKFIGRAFCFSKGTKTLICS